MNYWLFCFLAKKPKKIVVKKEKKERPFGLSFLLADDSRPSLFQSGDKSRIVHERTATVNLGKAVISALAILVLTGAFEDDKIGSTQFLNRIHMFKVMKGLIAFLKK